MKHFILFLLLSTALSSCKKEDNVLPDITMEGKNTFGCLVNGELWLPKGRGDGSSPFVVDMIGNSSLFVGVDNYRNNTGLSLFIKDSSGIKSNHVYVFTNESTGYCYAQYNYSTGKGGCFYDKIHMISGKMTLSKLENGIVSGTFEFTTYNPACGDTIKVTEGRFDL